MFEADDIRSLANSLVKAALESLQVEQDGKRLRMTVSRAQRPRELKRPSERPPSAAQVSDLIVTARYAGRVRFGHPGPLGKAVQPGDAVSPGQIVACLEVGQALLPVVAQAYGIATRWLVEEGTLVGFGTPILAFAAERP